MCDSVKINEAGFWRRAIAVMIDGVITIPIIGLLKGLGDVWFEIAFSIILFSAYVVGFFASKWEATPGMKIMGVRVVNAGGNRLGTLGALRWISMGLIVMLICLAPYIWFLSLILEHASMDQLVAMQRAGESPAMLLAEVAEKQAIDVATMGEYAVMSAMGTLLLVVFWMLTVAVLPKKRGLHNLAAKTYMVKSR